MILKIDRPIINEFLGALDDECISIATRSKTVRAYGKKGGDVGDFIIILTPLMAKDGEALRYFLNMQRILGTPLKSTEHKRGKNYVYTFEKE